MALCAAALGLAAGSLFKNVSTAIAIAPFILLPMVIYGGFFVTSANSPAWLAWIQWWELFHAKLREVWKLLGFHPSNMRLLELWSVNYQDWTSMECPEILIWTRLDWTIASALASMLQCWLPCYVGSWFWRFWDYGKLWLARDSVALQFGKLDVKSCGAPSHHVKGRDN